MLRISYVSLANRHVVASGHATLESMVALVKASRRPIFMVTQPALEFAAGYIFAISRTPLSERALRTVPRARILEYLELPEILFRATKREVRKKTLKKYSGQPLDSLSGLRGYWMALALALMVHDGFGSERFPERLFAERL